MCQIDVCMIAPTLLQRSKPKWQRVSLPRLALHGVRKQGTLEAFCTLLNPPS
jgi:hypothetical protein